MRSDALKTDLTYCDSTLLRCASTLRPIADSQMMSSAQYVTYGKLE
jgi:hypothetical protein